MKGWPSVKAKEVVTFRTGKLDSNAAEKDGKYPFFTCANETYRINNFAFDTECVLLAGNNAAGIFPLKYYRGKFNAYQRTYIIEPIKKDELNTKFLYELFKQFLKSFEQTSTGATTKFLTIGILNNLWLHLPPLSIQKKIAAFLSAYDDLIETNERRIQILETMAEELYKEWFVRLRFPGHETTKIVKGVPEGWEVKKLSEIAELAYGKALKEEDRLDGSIPVYGSSGIVGFHNKALQQGPGIVVGRKGNVGNVIWSDHDFYPIDTTYFVKTNFSLNYVFYLLKRLNFINNDSAVPGLNREQAYSNQFFLPSTTLIESFEKIVHPIRQMIFFKKESISLLKSSRDRLLSRLVSGKIDLSELEIQFPPSMKEETKHG